MMTIGDNKTGMTRTLDGEDGGAGDAHTLHGIATHVLHSGLADDEGVHAVLRFELVL